MMRIFSSVVSLPKTSNLDLIKKKTYEAYADLETFFRIPNHDFSKMVRAIKAGKSE